MEILLDALAGIVLGAAVWWLITWGMDQYRELVDVFFIGSGRNPFIPLALVALGITAATLFIERAPWRLVGAAGVLLVMFVSVDTAPATRCWTATSASASAGRPTSWPM
jgi:hypothetical protein